MTETPSRAPEGDPDDPDGAGGYDAELDDPEDDTTGYEGPDADTETDPADGGQAAPSPRHRAETSGEASDV